MEFYFGRFKVNGKSESKYEFIKKGLTEKDMEVWHQNFRWSFVDFDEKEKDGRLFLYGYLVKYSNTQQPVVNTTRQKIISTIVSDHVVARSFFFLEKDADIISYSPVIPHIGKNQFRDVFAKLFMKVYHSSGSIKNVMLESFKEKAKAEEKKREKEYKIIKKEMNELDSIRKISFTLRPSNPCNSKMWRKIDEKLKQLEVSRYSVTYENDRGFLNASFRGSEIYAMIAMVMCGYGKGKILGKKGGETAAIKIAERKPIEDKREEPILILEKSEIDQPIEMVEELAEDGKLQIYSDIVKRSKE